MCAIGLTSHLGKNRGEERIESEFHDASVAVLQCSHQVQHNSTYNNSPYNGNNTHKYVSTDEGEEKRMVERGVRCRPCDTAATRAGNRCLNRVRASKGPRPRPRSL